jgi:hypothetical protein
MVYEQVGHKKDTKLVSPVDENLLQLRFKPRISMRDFPSGG